MLDKSFEDATLDEVEMLWDEAGDRYRTYWESIEAKLPIGLKQMYRNYYLHDAKVLSMGQQGDAFVIVLRLDTPPHDLLIFNYTLAGEPSIDKNALPPAMQSQGDAEWLYDEVEVGDFGPGIFLHSILFSNGWEVRLPLRNVQISQMQPLIPCSQTNLIGTPAGS